MSSCRRQFLFICHHRTQRPAGSTKINSQKAPELQRIAVVEVKPIGTQRLALWPCNQYVEGPFVCRKEAGIGAQLAWGVSDRRKTARNRRQDCSDCTVNRFHVFWPMWNAKARVMALYWSHERRCLAGMEVGGEEGGLRKQRVGVGVT